MVVPERASGNMTRRGFLKQLTGLGLLLFLPFPFSCSAGKDEDENLWYALGEGLFPCDEPGAPCVKSIGFLHHLQFTLNDPGYDPDIRRFIRQGFIRFKKYIEEQKIDFTKLPTEEKTVFLEKYARQTDEDWIYRLNVIATEAAFLDPYYGVNKHEITWKWAHHTPGVPRPDKNHDYFSLLEKRKISEVIRKI